MAISFDSMCWHYSSILKKMIGLIVILNGLTYISQAQNKTLILDDLNPNHFNRDFSHYDQKTAVFCAQIANLLYYDLSLIDLRINLLQLKYPENDIRYEFITEADSSDTQNEVLLFGTKDFALVAFRGTSSFKDWKTNLRNSSVKFENQMLSEKYRSLPSGHEGFRKSMINLTNAGFFDKLSKFISHYSDSVNSFPVYLTGHSFGGAMSSLCIKPLTFEHQFSFQGAYNFAPALAIACQEYSALTQEYGDRIYDIVNYADFVSRANHKRFRHIGQFYRMTKKDERRNCDIQSGLLFHQRERQIGYSFLEILLFPKTLFRYHKLDEYIQYLKLEQNTTSSVLDRGFDAGCYYKKEKQSFNKQQCDKRRNRLKFQKVP